MRITFIRHTSVATEPGVCYGQSDVDVSDTFVSEAQKLYANLQQHSFDAVYCSPLLRCRKLASFCGFPYPTVDNRLMELYFGDWEMKSWNSINDPQLQHWFDNWITETPTQGESFQSMLNRVEEFWEELKGLPYQHVAIFTHAGVIRAAGVINHQFVAAKAFEFKIEYGDFYELWTD